MGHTGLIGLMRSIKSHKPHSYLFSGGLAQGLFALLPIARAKLIGLQRVEHSEGFINVAADRQIVDRHPSDDAVWIDDVCRAQGHALFLV